MAVYLVKLEIVIFRMCEEKGCLDRECILKYIHKGTNPLFP